MRFNTPIRASKRDMLSAARHEAGHAMMAHSMGNHIYAVIVRRDGSGYCDVDIPASPVQNLRITIAGYVAERVLGGYKPSYKAMRRDPSQSDDLYDVQTVLMDGRVKSDIAIPAAFAYVTKFFQDPVNRAKLQRIAKRLVRTRVLFERSFV
jgi:hypothetical protein